MAKGDKIRVAHDAWVPSLSNRRLGAREAVREGEEMRVSHLITPDGQHWNLDNIQNNTTDVEMRAIKAIHLSRTPGEDRLIWTTTPDGMAKPKWVYRKLREAANVSTDSRMGDAHSTPGTSWKKLWRSEVIPKVKNFL